MIIQNSPRMPAVPAGDKEPAPMEETAIPPPLQCPRCAARLRLPPQRDGDVACAGCSTIFPLRGKALDLRILFENKENNWNAANFEQGYSKLSEIEDGFTHAARSGIPRFIEEYRLSRCKDAIAQWVVAGSPQSLLDLGCGCGWYDFRLRDTFGYGGAITGVDVSPHNINLYLGELARRRDDKTTALAANGEALPFADKSFDKVVMTEVLEHVAKPHEVFRELHRVLRDAGELIISTPSGPMCAFWETLFLPPQLLKRMLAPPSGDPGKRPYDQPLSYRKIARLLRANGFKIAEYRKAIFLPHESYLQFLPLPILHLLLRVAKLLEFLGKPVMFLGLHHLVKAVRI